MLSSVLRDDQPIEKRQDFSMSYSCLHLSFQFLCPCARCSMPGTDIAYGSSCHTPDTACRIRQGRSQVGLPSSTAGTNVQMYQKFVTAANCTRHVFNTT
eukprot:319467-Rhodomonas_salina.1